MRTDVQELWKGWDVNCDLCSLEIVNVCSENLNFQYWQNVITNVKIGLHV